MRPIRRIRRTGFLPTGAAILAMIGVLAVASGARGQLCAPRLFNAPTAGIPIEIASSSPHALVLLFRPDQREPIAQARTRPGRADLLDLFPDLESLAGGGVVFAQLESGGARVGPPLVIEPLTPLPRASDAWTARVVRAMDSNDRGAIESLLRMLPRARESLRKAVDLEETASAGSHAWRVYEDQWIVLSTSAGSVTIALRPDAAPRTAFHFRSLVEGGSYDGTMLRCLRDSATGQPALIQAGDPGGDGSGGAGTVVPYEKSLLSSAPGVVAAARIVGDPNSASSQFIVVLSEGLGGILDESSTPFAAIVSGGGAIRAITRDGAQAVMVNQAWLVPAPPYSGPHGPMLPTPPGDEGGAER